MDIGNRIKELRKLNNTKANELAKILGITPVYMSYLEKNTSQPSFELLQKICNYFNITLSEFFAEEIVCLPPELSKLAKRYNDLTEDEKNALRAILKLLLKE